MPLSLALPGFTMSSKIESREATIIIGWVSFVLHFLAAFYSMDIIRGGSSDWVPSPFFEYSNDVMRSLAITFTIYSFLFMIFASLALIKGVVTETRIYYFPWLIFTAAETLLLYYQVIYLVWRYSYDTNTILMAVIILIYTINQSYLYLIVLSNYRHLKRIQNPTLIYPDL